MSETIQNEQKFDKIKYNGEYNKKNYKRVMAWVNPSIAARVDDYCTAEGISKAEFIRRAIDALSR